MTNTAALVLTAAWVSLLLGVTHRSLSKLGFRGAEFWYLRGGRRGDGAPTYLRPERPIEAPDVFPQHSHFRYLDRRPQRERLLPAYLVPSRAPRISRISLAVWVGGGGVLLAFSGTAGLADRPLGGVLSGLGGIALLLLFLKGWRQNRWRSPGVAVAATLLDRAAHGRVAAAIRLHDGDQEGARSLLIALARDLRGLAPSSGEPAAIIRAASELERLAETAHDAPGDGHSRSAGRLG